NSETDYQHITNLNNRLNEAGYNSSTTNIKTSLIEALNNGCGVLNYIGHGYTTSWQTTGFSTSDVKSLTNNNQLPIIIAAGCQNGHFRLTTCLAESFLRGRDTNNNAIGAVGMLAFTTQIYWNPPMLAQDEFARILVSDSIGFTKNFGEVINAAYKSVIAKYKGSGADVACQWALFGDPSLVLRTKTPTKMIISHKQEIDTEEHTFQVNCDTNSATATLWLNGDIIDTKTVNNGSANLNIENIIDEGFIKLTITAQDKITYQADIKINQSSGIKESTSSSDYKIYPNPSTGEIIICGKDKTIDIRIFDNSGKFILSREIENGIPFSITNESGIYHIHILNDKSTHPIIIHN
ncbi:MAG: T9SS type A sorting domain-containing protein, partial [Bacteroidales bacterium]|nr:T9SS type A sorting domain-containing protein [Bacteroidales bacterium]